MSLYLFGCCLLVLYGSTMGYHDDDHMPDGRTVKEYLDLFGYTQEKYDALCKKAVELHRIEAKIMHKKFDENSHAAMQPVVDDLILSDEMIDDAIHELKKEKDDGLFRTKRAAFYPHNRWLKHEFKYIISDVIKDYTSIIERAMDEYEDKTCIEFKEADDMDEADIFFTHMKYMNMEVCASHLGDDPGIPFAQPIYLPPSAGCFRSVGLIMHELGHFLGLIHEHQRTDRCISFDNLKVPGAGRFVDSNRYSPYDYQSIMHYQETSGRDFDKLVTKDRRFGSTIGQESELSFWDTYVLNRRYCALCDNTFDCRNNGFRRIASCGGKRGCCDDDCQCPDGLDGDWCEKVEDDSDGACSPDDKTLYALTRYETDEEQCLTSPHYDDEGYKPGDECTWLIRNGRVEDNRCEIELWFEKDFDIPSESGFSTTCDNWVEVRLDAPRKPGQRFCGEGQQSFADESSDDHHKEIRTTSPVLVNFRTFLNAKESNKDKEKKGFKLCYRRVCNLSVDKTC